MAYGGVVKFPISLSNIYGETLIENQEKLYEVFFTEYSGLLKQNANIKVKDVLHNLNIQSTLMFFDRRTEQLLDMFEMYESNPHLIFNNSLWLHTVKTCKRMYRQSKL